MINILLKRFGTKLLIEVIVLALEIMVKRTDNELDDEVVGEITAILRAHYG